MSQSAHDLATPTKGRRTRQLEATYEVVRAARDHPTAEQVHARVRRKMAHISLGTVYRNLQKLAAERRIHIVEVGPRSTRFDGMVDTHEHFVCEQCGDITDLPATRRSPDTTTLRRAGFGVTRHAVTFFGLCPRCRPEEREHGSASA